MPDFNVQPCQIILRIHRVYPLPSVIKAGATVTVRHLGCTQRGGGNSFPVNFSPGWTAVFPLAPDAAGGWSLFVTKGDNISVPAIAKPRPTVSQSPHDFILGELVNSIANGDAATRHHAARYLLWFAYSSRADVREGVAQLLGNNEDRWLKIAVAFLNVRGTPHATVADLMAQPDQHGSEGNAAWALAKAGSSDYPNRLIRGVLRDMSVDTWGAAWTLDEFKDLPVVIQGVREVLNRDPAGSIDVAASLIRHGQDALIPDAVKAAVKLVAQSEKYPSALQSSSSLLRDHGSDEQFNVIPTTLRRLQRTNYSAYQSLLGSVQYQVSKRELRVAAVTILDDRLAYGSMRHCDQAAYAVQKLSGVDLGWNTDLPVSERDRTVARAAAWLTEHHGEY